MDRRTDAVLVGEAVRTMWCGGRELNNKDRLFYMQAGAVWQ